MYKNISMVGFLVLIVFSQGLSAASVEVEDIEDVAPYVSEEYKLLEKMRVRLVVSQKTQEREDDQKVRKERIRVQLDRVIDFDQELENLNKDRTQVVSDKNNKEPEKKMTKQEKVRRIQALFIQDAFKRYQSSIRGMGDFTDRDSKILNAVLCKENNRFEKMETYRNEMIEAIGDGPVTEAKKTICP
jgi:hypothetical protein